MLSAIGRLRLLPRPLSPWAATLLLFLFYILPAGALLLYAEHFVSARLTEILFPLPWLADGVAISLMLLWGTRTWPGVFLGSIFIWGVMRGDPVILVTVDAVGETLSVVVAVKILRACRFRWQLDRLADPLILLAAALAGRVIADLADIVGTVAGAWLTPHSLGIEYLRMATWPGTSRPAVTPELVSAMSRWQVNALTGIALTVPALLASPRKLRHALRSRRPGLAGLGLLAVLWVIGGLELSATWTCWPLLLSALMLVAWAAIDFGALTAALCTLLFACTASAAFCQGLGPLVTSDVFGGLAATWGFIGLLCCVSPVLTLVLTARQHHDRRLAALAERYRSLFMANPTPAWVTDAVSGAILMANAEAVRRYGYTESEFLLMKMSELSAEPSGCAELPSPDAELVAAPLIKHVTRDGRVMNVELICTPLELDGRGVALIYAVDLTDHQDLRQRLLATVDREPLRVAQELHDGLGQVLAGLAIGSESLLQRTEQAAAFDAHTVAQLRELSEHAEKAESQLFQLTSGVSRLPDVRGGSPMKLRASAACPERTLQSPDGRATAVTHSCPQATPQPDVRPAGRPRPDTASGPSAPMETWRSSLLAYLGVSILIVAACCIGGVISYALATAHHGRFSYADARLAVPSLAMGAVVCALLQGGWRYWPSVFLGMVLVRMELVGEPLATAAVLSALATAASCALVAVMRRWRFAPSLARWQDPLVLCVGAAAIWAVVILLAVIVSVQLASLGSDRVAPGVAALYASSAAHGGVWRNPAVLAAAARWWFDALVGTVLVVPTITLASTVRRVLRESLPELCAWCACLLGWTLLLLTVHSAQILFPLLALSILLVVWAAARLGVALASLATLIVAMLVAGSLATRVGAVATEDPAAGVIYVWGFVGVLTVIGLFLAALLAEHEGRRREIGAVNRRYRCLFHSDPRPLWLHDIRTGRILEANEPAARAYGYSMTEFAGLEVRRLLAPGMSPDALAAPLDRAVGPVAMKHQRKPGDSMEMEIWSYGTYLDGRRVSICFAHDVTERNTLKRMLFDGAELQRRELAAELRRTLSGPLAELRIVAHKVMLALGRRADPHKLRELLESLARRTERAAESCREVAHRLSPLQANCGNLIAALEALRRQDREGVPLEISVVAESPLSLDPQQSADLYSLLSEILARCRPGRQGSVRVALGSFGHTVRVAVDADLQTSPARTVPSLARHPSILIRVRAMGARLWERSIGAAHTRLICDYPLWPRSEPFVR